MSDVTKLLEEATPLPWEMDHPDDGVFRIRSGQVRAVDRLVSLDMLRENAALIVYAVNRLPDLEAAVDALERLVDAAAGITTSKAGWISGKSTGGYELMAAQEGAIAALARLREAVPA